MPTAAPERHAARFVQSLLSLTLLLTAPGVRVPPPLYDYCCLSAATTAASAATARGSRSDQVAPGPTYKRYDDATRPSRPLVVRGVF